MAGAITKEGIYILFRSTNGQEVLSLEGEQFALVEGPKGEDMITGKGTFEREQVLARGSFKLVEFDDGEPLEDPHLFLQRNHHYQEVIFPEGIPSGEGGPRRYLQTRENLGIDEVETYIRSLVSGSGGEALASSGEEEFSGITHHLNQMSFPAERGELIEFAQKRQATSEVLSDLHLLEERNFDSLRDVMEELGDQKRLQQLAIDNYEEESAEEMIARLEAMEPAELRDLEGVEKRRKDRKEVIEAIEDRLRGEQR